MLLLLVVSGAAAMPAINASWPATIKYNAADCDASTAQEAFVRLPGGCNPTPTGANATGRAWHARCDATATWEISWYSDLACSAFDFEETLATPLECETNDKGQKESWYCVDQNLPPELDPTLGSDYWHIQTALFSEPGCDDATFFMYRYYRAGVCVAELGTGLLVDPLSDSSVSFASYDNDLCQGEPVSRGELDQNGTCLQLGADLYMRVTDVAAQSNNATIFDVLRADDDTFSTLLTLVEAADDFIEEALRGDGPLTLFAPTNDAFDAFPTEAATAVLNDTAALTNVLLYHAVTGIITSADISGGQILATTNGETLTVSIDDGGVRLIFPTGDALVISGDVSASNGVVHVIDTVLEPPVGCSLDEDCLDGYFCDLAAQGGRKLLFGVYEEEQSGLCRTTTY